MDRLATESLLNALLECFEKLDINFLEEVTIDGEDGYRKITNSDVVTVWETYFCSAVVKLSVSPRRNDASPNPDALRAWRRGKVNDKTKSTFPNFMQNNDTRHFRKHNIQYNYIEFFSTEYF